MRKAIRRVALILFVPVLFIILVPFSLALDGRSTAFDGVRDFFANWNNYWNKEN